MNKGWRKQWRKIWDNPLFKGYPNHFIVWSWILDHVVFEDGTKVRFKGNEIELKPGQLTCGALEIARETGCKLATIQRVTNKLAADGLIDKQTTNLCSLITVINWKQYQENDKQNDKQMINKMITNKEVSKNDKKLFLKENYTKEKILKTFKKLGIDNPTGYLKVIQNNASDEAIGKAWNEWQRGCGIASPGAFYSRCLYWQSKLEGENKPAESENVSIDE